MSFSPKKADAAMMAEPLPKRPGRPSPLKNTKLTDLRPEVAQAIKRYYKKHGVPGVLAHLKGEPLKPDQIRSYANKLGIHADRADAHKRAAQTIRSKKRKEVAREGLPTPEQIELSRGLARMPESSGVLVCTTCYATHLDAREAFRAGWSIGAEKHKGATTHIGACVECQSECNGDESWNTQGLRVSR